MPNQRRADQVPLMVYIPVELRDAAKAEAERRGETVSDAVRRMLRRYVRR